MLSDGYSKTVNLTGREDGIEKCSGKYWIIIRDRDSYISSHTSGWLEHSEK